MKYTCLLIFNLSIFCFPLLLQKYLFDITENYEGSLQGEDLVTADKLTQKSPRILEGWVISFGDIAATNTKEISGTLKLPLAKDRRGVSMVKNK